MLLENIIKFYKNQKLFLDYMVKLSTTLSVNLAIIFFIINNIEKINIDVLLNLLYTIIAIFIVFVLSFIIFFMVKLLKNLFHKEKEEY